MHSPAISKQVSPSSRWPFHRPLYSTLSVPFFYKADGNNDFRLALRDDDLARMNRNHEFGGLVTDLLWKPKDPYECGCRPKAEHFKHRPIDELLAGMLSDGWERKHLDALVWLHDKGYEVNDRADHHDIPDVMPAVLVNLFQGAFDRHQAEGFGEMIRFLNDRGHSIPLWVNMKGYAALDDNVLPFVPQAKDPRIWDALKFYSRPFENRWFSFPMWLECTMNLALRSYSPPALLEALLQGYAQRGYSLTDHEMGTKDPPNYIVS
ncbi:hypothetical protein FGRMN_11026 [Fusarium graminum]|nr:hypothetical protein FGRMN_11026 [Fusarium graminum]